MKSDENLVNGCKNGGRDGGVDIGDDSSMKIVLEVQELMVLQRSKFWV